MTNLNLVTVVAVEAAEGEIITVFAPKGGAGTTTLATNLGVVLARAGHRVCVVDLDIAAGDIAISLLLNPVRTLADAVPMAGHLDTAGAESLLTQYRPGLQMLLAPCTPGDTDKVSATLVGELLRVLRRMFRYVVVDTAARLSELVRAPIAARIPYSRAVPRSINNYVPITLENRRDQVSKAIAGFAQEHLLSAPQARQSRSVMACRLFGGHVG